MMRLNKYLALCGLGSRRKSEVFIQAGSVAVNGNMVQSLSQVIDETIDVVTVKGQPIQLPDKLVYLLLNKPKGYVTSAHDELGRKTVMHLIPGDYRVFSVGRLDKDTKGALLLTNDGALAFRLMHPRFQIDKIYHVTLNMPITIKHIQKLMSGIMLDDGITHKCDAKVIGQDHRTIEMTLHEGRKRQVRRMLQALGYQVTDLVRTQFASLTIKDLKPGEWRFLTNPEIAQLKSLAPGKT